MENTENTTLIESQINYFKLSICPFKYSDIERIIEIADSIWLSIDDVIKEIKEIAKDKWFNIFSYNFDIVSIMYDYVWLEVEQLLTSLELEEIQILCYNNFMCTNFEISEKDIIYLLYIKENNIDTWKALTDNECFQFFINDLGDDRLLE